jgi:hypothetical protein
VPQLPPDQSPGKRSLRRTFQPRAGLDLGMRLAVREMDATYRDCGGNGVHLRRTTMRLPATSHHSAPWAGVTLSRGFWSWRLLARRTQSAS